MLPLEEQKHYKRYHNNQVYHSIAAPALSFFPLCSTCDCSRPISLPSKKTNRNRSWTTCTAVKGPVARPTLWHFDRGATFLFGFRDHKRHQCRRWTNPKKSCWQLTPYSRWISVTWGLLVILYVLAEEVCNLNPVQNGCKCAKCVQFTKELICDTFSS